jgi:hypothetical protein
MHQNNVFLFFFTSFFTSTHQNNPKTPKKINLKIKKIQNFSNARLDRNAKRGLKKGQPNFTVPISSKYLGKRNRAAISPLLASDLGNRLIFN